MQTLLELTLEGDAVWKAELAMVLLEAFQLVFGDPFFLGILVEGHTLRQASTVRLQWRSLFTAGDGSVFRKQEELDRSSIVSQSITDSNCDPTIAPFLNSSGSVHQWASRN